MPQIFHPLLSPIASATNNELGKYVEYLNTDNKILREHIPGQIHNKPEERERLLKFGRVVGRAIEEMMTIVSPSTFHRWVRDEKTGNPTAKNSKDDQRKPKDIRKLVVKEYVGGLVKSFERRSAWCQVSQAHFQNCRAWLLTSASKFSIVMNSRSRKRY